jgi:hypothetical protein
MYNSLIKPLIIPPLIESKYAAILALIWTPSILVRINNTVENRQLGRFSSTNKKNRTFKNFHYVI